ncbi:MAG: N-acetylmuramoyl-L-alanine amidase [Fimbriimonadaceae bacterium]|nr:N-acetylmuramoyl-L-alanine amidase [Fimbriimonadaceae bacterium]QYK55096.1 MAG: N-acetylmuramoyl-L-alanine amidase [Fimbriimonadaceae bacterium]
MRVRTLGLLLWMAAATAWAQSGPSLSVEYAHLGVFKDALWYRSGDVTYVSPVLLRKIGWSVELSSETAKVSAEGRDFSLEVKAFQGKPYLPLEIALKLVGAAYSWSEGESKMTVLGSVRNIESTPEGVRIDSTLGIQPRAYLLTGPDRFVVDFTGAKLDDRVAGSLPSGWRVMQWQPNVVRFVVENPAVATMAVPDLAAGRRFELALPAAVPVQNVQTVVTVGKPEIVASDERGASFRMAVTGRSDKKPSAVFLDPRTVQLTFPGARADSPGIVKRPIDGVASIESTEDGAGRVVVVWNLERPMAFDLTTTGSAATLRLRSPNVFASGLVGRVIVIDPGHGGKDGGATTAGVREKDLALKTATQIAEELSSRGASVIMTRSTDEFISLTERPSIANRSKADAFISVHFNSNSINNSRSGTITFYHAQNSMDMLLAACINQEVAKVSGLPDLGIWSDQRIYKSGFAVLRGAEMPSVLLELGFVNHATDRTRAQQEQFRQVIGQAVARGVEVFFSGK